MIAAIFEVIVSIFTAIIEAISSFFVVGEALTAGEAIIVLFAFILELLFWLVLWIYELLVSLFAFRKPRKVKKPVLWRPQKKADKVEDSE